MSLDLVFMHIGIFQFISIGTQKGSFSITNLLTFDFKLFLAMPESIKTAEADEINANENASNVTNKAAVCKERQECVEAHKSNDI